MGDAVLEALRQVQVVRVEAVLTLRHVDPWKEVSPKQIRESCLWPRVTLRAGERRKVIPFTGYAAASEKAVPGERNIWEVAVLGFCGGNGKSPLHGGRRGALEAAVNGIRSKVQTAVWRASETKRVQEKVHRARVRARKERFRKELFDWLQTGRGSGWEQVREHELYDMFRDFKHIQVVKHVLET